MRTRVNGLVEYPVGRDGSLLHYPLNTIVRTAAGHESKPPRWVPNDPFTATLRLDRMESGRSAKYVIWQAVSEVDGRCWPMFITDLLELVQHSTITGGVISARWQVRKRGQNYGIALAPERAH